MEIKKGYKSLIVWQKAVDLVVQVYLLTENFPKTEVYGLVSQMQRSAVSIPSNIAEGTRRKSKKDFSNFLAIAYGSGSELETQVEIVKRLSFGKTLEYNTVDGLLEEVMKMLNTMISRLSATD